MERRLETFLTAVDDRYGIEVAILTMPDLGGEDPTEYANLIFEDWETSIDRQAEALSAMIREQWGDAVRRVADVACGIGTQALGLAALGFDVTAADSSDKAVARARREAAQRQLTLHFHTADMRQCQEHLGGGFDLVIACDNAVPHLLNDDDILLALRQMHACLRCGGGVLLSVRDYAVETKGDSTIRPYGVRDSDAEYIMVGSRNSSKK